MIRTAPWVRDVTRDAIRHFAWGVGDNNPLWIDPEYAAASHWRTTIAPPCFVYALDETTVAPGYEDLTRDYRSAHWTWFDVLTVDRSVQPQAFLLGETSLDTGVIGQHGRVDYVDAQGVLVAQVRVTTERADPDTGRTSDPEPAYDQQELESIEQTVLGERRRGGKTRYWEDIQVGERLDPLLKGPVSIMDIVAWCAATQGIPEPGSEFSEGGLESEGVTGPQQVAWACHLVTNWMGDDAFLHRLEIDLDRAPGLGSTTTWTGVVNRCWQQPQCCLVELELAASDRRDQRIGGGRAHVVLASREFGPVKLPLDPGQPEIADEG